MSRPMPESPPEVVSDLLDYLTSCAVRRPPGPVPRWRLAQEFLSERLSLSLRCFGDGCAFRNTTYRPSDYATPNGEFGVPMHHPRFLEWIGLPESASLLEKGPGMWLNSLSRDQVDNQTFLDLLVRTLLAGLFCGCLYIVYVKLGCSPALPPCVG